MSSSRPTRVYACFKDNGKVKHNQDNVENTNKESGKNLSSMDIVATADVSEEPDVCKVYLVIKSSKDTVQDAKNSVIRRLEYAKQAMHNLGFKEETIDIVKVLERIDHKYTYSAEVQVKTSDYTKAQTLSNQLSEKLDGYVTMTPVQFSHSPSAADALRRRASILALQCARKKASELAQVMKVKVGQVVSVTEQDVREWHGAEDTDGVTLTPLTLTLQQRRAAAALHVTVQIRAQFSLKAEKPNKT